MAKRKGDEGVIIAYWLGKGPRPRISRFTEKVLGQDRKRGKKVYLRRGMLDTVPHWKLNRGVLLVWKDGRGKVERELRKWASELRSWPVKLTRED